MTSDEDRKARLAEALRINLRKRKAQARDAADATAAEECVPSTKPIV